MNNQFYFGAFVGLAIANLVFFSIQYSDAGVPPPTPAWDEIETGVIDVVPFADQNFTNAIVYNDKLFLLSDGSINLTITSFP